MPQKRRRRPKGGDANYPYIFKQYGDKTVRSRYPIFTHKWSAKQRAVRDRVKAASRYAVAVAADPAAVAFYKAAIRRKKKQHQWTVRNAAMSDFFNSPTIGEMELRARRGQGGAKLSIDAHDKFDLSSVTVSLRRKKQVLLAETPVKFGMLTWQHVFASPLPDGDDWEVVVAATDRPGNRTTAVLPASAVKWERA